MRRATTAWYTFLVKNLLNLPSVILVLIFVNVKTLIMLILFLEQASGRPTWSLRATWCPWALRWWLLVYTFGCTCFTYTALNICFFIISNLAKRCFFLNFQYWFTVATTANFVHFVWRTGVWRNVCELTYGALILRLFIFPSFIFFLKEHSTFCRSLHLQVEMFHRQLKFSQLNVVFNCKSKV